MMACLIQPSSQSSLSSSQAFTLLHNSHFPSSTVAHSTSLQLFSSSEIIQYSSNNNNNQKKKLLLLQQQQQKQHRRQQRLRCFRSISGSLNWDGGGGGGGGGNIEDVTQMVKLFDSTIPIHSALTPPGCWYTNPAFLDLEMERVFYRGWRVAGLVGQVANPGDFLTGRLGTVQFLICRDSEGELHAFHNVCRHHASLVAFDSGNASCFVCPYHAWTYGLDGKLQKATRTGGIQNFKDNSLLPISLATWGPFLLINLYNQDVKSVKENDHTVGTEWLGSSNHILSNIAIDRLLKHVARREYLVDCNWKVFCDNYLDGGYHVPIAHGGLAAGLDLKSYSTELFEKVSIQTCVGAELDNTTNFDRLGRNVAYAFIYPNFMINRYGPWMDTNLVLPLGVSKCFIIFDYFLELSYQEDRDFIEKSLVESDKVQVEDKFLCESVQKGLTSPAYRYGRYAPNVEMALYHFHCILQKNLLEG